MRLLNSQTLQFGEFIGEDTPSYAILSHTWIHGEEVTYQDMENLTDEIKSRSGYRKILKTAELARKHVLAWFWIDTCCIDKKSSAELSEAINSMFAWYKGCSVCFAYLNDVLPVDGAFAKDARSGKEEVSAIVKAIKLLEHCRWFTRGWTLQELLAPGDIEFYDAEWNWYAKKSDAFAHVLAAVTGIALHVLQGRRRISKCSVAERLSWASKRSTQRREDKAYCLLGLFDINMPLLYGEGSKAFIRLQEEILKREADHTIFMWNDPNGSPGCYRSLLANDPSEFQNGGQIQLKLPDAGLAEVEECVFTVHGLRMRIPLLPINAFRDVDIRMSPENAEQTAVKDLRNQKVLIPFFRCGDRKGPKDEYSSVLLKRCHANQNQYTRVCSSVVIRFRDPMYSKLSDAYKNDLIRATDMFVRPNPESFGPGFGVQLYGIRFPSMIWRSDVIALPDGQNARVVPCTHQNGRQSRAQFVVRQQDRLHRGFRLWDFDIVFEERMTDGNYYMLEGKARLQTAEETEAARLEVSLRLTMATLGVENHKCIAAVQFRDFDLDSGWSSAEKDQFLNWTAYTRSSRRTSFDGEPANGEGPCQNDALSRTGSMRQVVEAYYRQQEEE